MEYGVLHSSHNYKISEAAEDDRLIVWIWERLASGFDNVMAFVDDDCSDDDDNANNNNIKY